MLHYFTAKSKIMLIIFITRVWDGACVSWSKGIAYDYGNEAYRRSHLRIGKVNNCAIDSLWIRIITLEVIRLLGWPFSRAVLDGCGVFFFLVFFLDF